MFQPIIKEVPRCPNCQSWKIVEVEYVEVLTYVAGRDEDQIYYMGERDVIWENTDRPSNMPQFYCKSCGRELEPSEVVWIPAGKEVHGLFI